MPAKLAPDRTRGLIIACGTGLADLRAPALFGRLLAWITERPRLLLLTVTDSNHVEDADFETELLALGAAEVRRATLAVRADAEKRELLDAIDHVDLLLLTGTQPLRMSGLIGGTPLARALRRRNAEGLAVGGIGPGAALLCEHMLASGAEGATPRLGGATLAPGLGLTNRVVIDQGGQSGDRVGRLLAALALNPFALGLGIDAGTAAVIGSDNVLEIVGTGGATLIDPSEAAESNVADLAPGAPIRITNLRLHALTAGARYDLDFRRALS